MTELLTLGAIDKLTQKYVYPKIANKNNEYYCPDCNKDLILCHGDIRNPYFRHKVDLINPCNYYFKPSESQIHKDAKLLMKTLLENKTDISIIRKCICCNKNNKFKIPDFDDTSKIVLEYRFDYNGLKIADVAFIDNDELICIFEIYNTHKTNSNNRPEPWFEINANELIKLVNNNNNNNNNNNFIIPCIRSFNCDKCNKLKKLEEENKLNEKIKLKKLEENKLKTIIDNKILQIRNRNKDKIIRLQKIIKSMDDEFYVRKSDSEYYNKLDNLIDEVEIKLVSNNILYNNYDDLGFIITNKFTNKQIYLTSLTSCIIDNIKLDINFDDLIKWYNNDKNNNNNNIFKLYEHIQNKNIDEINKYFSNLDVKQIKYFNKELLLQTDLITNNINYSIQHTAGANIYVIKLPNTNNTIKYSIASKKIYMNKKWHYDKILDELLFDKIYLNVSYNDKEEIKNYGGYFDMNKKKWFITSNNRYKDIILNKWSEYKL
jgi:hypothetical protein